jgi:hypothetical protein
MLNMFRVCFQCLIQSVKHFFRINKGRKLTTCPELFLDLWKHLMEQKWKNLFKIYRKFVEDWRCQEIQQMFNTDLKTIPNVFTICVKPIMHLFNIDQGQKSSTCLKSSLGLWEHKMGENCNTCLKFVYHMFKVRNGEKSKRDLKFD